MTKSQIVIGVAVSFAGGILVASRHFIGQDLVLCALASAVPVFALSYISNQRQVAAAALFLICFCLGAYRLNSSIKPNGYEELLGLKRQMEGFVVEDVDVRPDKQMLTFRPLGHEQKILVTTTLYQEYFYGDWLVLEGKVEEPKNFEDFDYQKYLQRYDVFAVMRYPKILVLKNHRQNPAKEELLKTKHAFSKRLSEVLGEPEDSLLLGILIGAKKTLPQKLLDDFQTAGISHIISLSGFNITIIVAALANLARLLGRRASFWLSLAFIAAFAVATGASASIVRASIMGLLMLVALSSGRQYKAAPSLFFAGLVMLAINPKILYWDVGFQLSFAATLGLVYIYPALDRLTEGWPSLFSLKSVLLTTLAAISATMPLVLLHFGRFSLIAPLANMAVLPVLPAVMLFGFLSVLPVAGPGFGLLAQVLLSYIIKISGVLARAPHASVDMKITGWLFVLLAAAVMALGMYLRSWARRRGSVEEVKNL